MYKLNVQNLSGPEAERSLFTHACLQLRVELMTVPGNQVEVWVARAL
ncbi:MAG: hypothetical protein OXE84_07145 [Rhodobacteraceae bacterium]|nr:hypothetical protein [Paracoccaceae bacterium]MCY4197469.1 hypothetical protein [Paracoccaceae bacterium]MCY4327920.1 hypothetical protein [Paracoccaceae bacterium]